MIVKALLLISVSMNLALGQILFNIINKMDALSIRLDEVVNTYAESLARNATAIELAREKEVIFKLSLIMGLAIGLVALCFLYIGLDDDRASESLNAGKGALKFPECTTYSGVDQRFVEQSTGYDAILVTKKGDNCWLVMRDPKDNVFKHLCDILFPKDSSVAISETVCGSAVEPSVAISETVCGSAVQPLVAISETACGSALKPSSVIYDILFSNPDYMTALSSFST